MWAMWEVGNKIICKAKNTSLQQRTQEHNMIFKSIFSTQNVAAWLTVYTLNICLLEIKDEVNNWKSVRNDPKFKIFYWIKSSTCNIFYVWNDD